MDQVEQYDKRCAATRNYLHHTIMEDQVYGFYTWGPRGCGKTTGIERALQELKKPYLLLRGTSTGPGVFKTLSGAKDQIVWFNDDPGILRDKQGQQYLLGMLEPIAHPTTGKMVRLVTKTRERVKEGSEESFIFTGKLIFDSNTEIGAYPTLKAVQDRLNISPFFPFKEELAAVITYLARLTPKAKSRYEYVHIQKKDKHIWEKTSVKERAEIAEYVLSLDAENKAMPSLRRFVNVLKYSISEQTFGYTTSWRDYARDQVRQDGIYENSQTPSRKDQRLEHERRELMDLLEDVMEFREDKRLLKGEVIRIWLDATSNKNSKQFRRRLDELPETYRQMYASLPDKRNG